VPIVAMTAYAMKGDRERMLGVGMDAYLSKPARPVDLFSAVERYGVPAPVSGAAQQPALPQGERSTSRIDHEAALARAGDSEELLGELAQMFIEQRPGLVSEIQGALEKKDATGLRRAAHTLKGSVSLFGAREATRLAAELERMGKEGSFEESEAALRALEAELAEVEAELKV
jgi:HPt (histidine-containing phosphotransfer) domain-containing protein